MYTHSPPAPAFFFIIVVCLQKPPRCSFLLLAPSPSPSSHRFPQSLAYLTFPSAMACSSLRRPQYPHSYHRHLSAAPQQNPPACRFWLQGRCNRGESCHFSHDSPVAAALSTPPASRGSAYCWRRPTAEAVSPTPPSQERNPRNSTCLVVEDDGKKVKGEGEGEVSDPPLLPSSSSTEVAAVADTLKTTPPQLLPSSSSSSSTEEAAAAATGVSASIWPILVVTCEDGSVCVDDAENREKKRLHMLPAPITCVLDGPVQQRLHPGLLLFGLASGDIAVGMCKPELSGVDMLFHILPGPPQSCGKVLCLVTARTRSHPLLLLAGYENGAILCWTATLTPVAATFSPLCTLQYPGAPPVVSMDISDDDDDLWGHHLSSSVVGGGGLKKHLLYSASSFPTQASGSITVWDLDTFCALQVLQCGAAVTKLLSTGRYLFIGSSDGSIQAWGPPAASTSTGSESRVEMELLHTQPSPRQTATAIVDLCGQHMEDGCHLLFAAYSDSTVSTWELPSFKEANTMHIWFGVTAMDVAANADGQAVLLLAGTGGSALCMPIRHQR